MLVFNYLGKMGRLGNQMFQYASTKGIARKLNVPFMIPDHDEVIVDAFGNKLRIELFDCFDIKPDYKGVIPLPMEKHIQEDFFGFNKFIFSLDAKEDLCLIGYFQSERYFKHIEDEIRKDFTFHSHIVNDCLEALKNFKSPVALHIRRTDYIANSENHFNLQLDYYEESLKYFDTDRQVIIFSDDPQWAKEQKLFSDDRFLISEGNNSYHDLYLMSQCQDFIIANSTFSWWGSWLSNNKNKKVIAPKKWFGPGNQHLYTKDLRCDGWITI